MPARATAASASLRKWVANFIDVSVGRWVFLCLDAVRSASCELLPARFMGCGNVAFDRSAESGASLHSRLIPKLNPVAEFGECPPRTNTDTRANKKRPGRVTEALQEG